jgi:hypothetical protein
MRTTALLLTILAVSCAPLHQPVVVLEQHPDQPPEICEAVTTAVNRGDWAALRLLAKSETMANGAISSWENSQRTGHSVRVGKFLMAQTFAGTDVKQYQLYSFELKNTDGTVNPHWLQIKVGEKHGQPEILDFWNFGW